MIIYNNTLPATFLRRLNRFSAEVLLNGVIEKVHVKNTGRLGGVTRVTTISTKGDPPNGGSCSPETHSPRS